LFLIFCKTYAVFKYAARALKKNYAMRRTPIKTLPECNFLQGALPKSFRVNKGDGGFLLPQCKCDIKMHLAFSLKQAI